MSSSIKTKLVLGLGLILILLCIVGGFAGYSLQKTATATQRIHDKNLLGLSAIDDINGLMNINFSNILYSLIFPSSDVAKNLPKSIDKNGRKILDILNDYEQKYALTVDEKAAAHKLLKQQKKLFPIVDDFVKFFETHPPEAARDYYFNRVHQDYKQFFIYQDQLAHLQASNSQVSYELAQHTVATSKKIILAAVIAALLATLIITILLTRMITRPLDRANALAKLIASGKLDNAYDNPYKDEFGTMLASIYDMQHQLADTVIDVRSKSEAVRQGISEINDRNQELSSRTQQQAASLEQTAASMEEISSTVKQNADNAAKADQLTQNTRGQAENGDEVIQQAIAAMEEITQASHKITDIISLIDNIAFQTNLLALNASVEAARAGEHGRGFAVVASEVRSLASRSAEAAKEITQLVNNSSEKVKLGAERVERSGQTLHEIMESVNKVSQLVSEMSTAGQEQASGIEQINLAVAQMDQTTQQNSALVEQTQVANQKLLNLAHALSEQVATFQIKQGGLEPEADESQPALLEN